MFKVQVNSIFPHLLFFFFSIALFFCFFFFLFFFFFNLKSSYSLFFSSFDNQYILLMSLPIFFLRHLSFLLQVLFIVSSFAIFLFKVSDIFLFFFDNFDSIFLQNFFLSRFFTLILSFCIYIYIYIYTKNLWNMKVTVIPVIIGALGTVIKGFVLGLEDLEIRERVKTIQTRVLKSARILGRVSET